MNKEQFELQIAKIADKQELLKIALSKRPHFPQIGDIFVFNHPETIGVEWAVLAEKNPKSVLIVAADNTPLLGSADIEVSNGRFNLRCGHSVKIRKKYLTKAGSRFDFLDEWDLQHALNKIKQIKAGTLRSSVLQQETDNDVDYQDWMAQVQRGKMAMATIKYQNWLEIFYEKLKNLGSRLLPQDFQMMPITLAFVAVLVLVVSLTVLLVPTLSEENQLDKNYKQVLASKNVEIVEELQEFKFQWEGRAANVSAFSAATPDLESAKAFGAGLFTGRATLLNKGTVEMPELLLPPMNQDSWLNTKWANDFELGRWTFLLWTVSLEDEKPKAFWDEQRQILAQFKAAYRHKNNKKAEKVLYQLEKRIEPLLKKLPVNADDSDIYEDLASNLETMMNFLAP